MIVYYIFVPVGMDKDIMLGLLILVLLVLLSFFLKKEPAQVLKGQFLKHSTLVILSYIVVHFQYYIDFVFGNVTESYLFIWVNQGIVLQAMVLSIIGLLSFLIGYLLYKKPAQINKVKFIMKPVSTTLLTYLASLFLAIYFFTVNPLYLLGYYGTVDMGQEATYAILVFTVIVYAVIIQNCRNMVITNEIPDNFKKYIWKQGRFLLLLLVIYLASVIISGDRGPIITIGLCYVSGYFLITKKKLKFKYGLIIAVVGAFMITLLGVARSLDKDLDFKTRIVQGLDSERNMQEESFLPQTQELAGSVRALHTTVNYIPETHDYLYGRFLFQNITVVIPFFSAFMPVFFENESYQYGGSANFVTWINQGENRTYGEGTTCIADFYFDFGLGGVIIGMFFFGYVMRYAEHAMYSNGLSSLFSHSFSIVYLSFAIYIARSSVFFSLRMVIWVFLLLLVNKFVFNRGL